MTDSLPPFPEIPLTPEQRNKWLWWAQSAVDAAVLKERAACAAICENERLYDPNPASDGDIAYDLAIKDCAAAIRAQGEKENG